MVVENQFVRVIELMVTPGDTTLLHSHQAASIVIFLSNSSFAIQNPKQAPVVNRVKLGEAVYRDYDDKPVIHTVWSADESTFRCLVVELKQKGNDCAGALAEMQVLWAEKKVNAYRLNLEKDKSYSMPKSTCNYVVVSLGIIDVSIDETKSVLSQGQCIFTPSSGKTTIFSHALNSTLLFQIK